MKKKQRRLSASSSKQSDVSGSSSRKSRKFRKPSKAPSLAVVHPNERKKRQEKQIERRKLAQELLANALKEPEYLFEDATKEFASKPGKLEIHPTKTAPTLTEIENRFAREREQEKLKFFSVPIKMYDADENNIIDLTAVVFNEKDKVELHRYGSRVVLRPDGRVAAVEVEQEVMDELKQKRVSGEFCQCYEKEYDVGEKLRHSSRARRIFMSKVLMIENILRLPALVVLYYQRENAQLHDFIYQQNLLMLFIIGIIQGTRLAGVYFSKVGSYEPCRTLITCLTMIGNCVTAALFTSGLQQYSLVYIDYMLYEDPYSLQTLHEKQNMLSGQKVSYPYVTALIIINMTIINFVQSLFLLICPKCVMDELKNGFLLIVILTSFSLSATAHYLINVVILPFLSPTPLGWDGTQIAFSFVVTTKWAMWRFYILQQVVRGKTLHINEDSHQVVALTFAI